MIDEKKHIDFIEMYGKAYLDLQKEKRTTEMGRNWG